MKLNRLRTTLAASLALAATAVQAQQVVNLTPTSNIKAVLLALKPGDTLKLTGTFETAVRFGQRDFGGVTLDARDATLREGLFLQGVRNLNIVGGTYGRTDADTLEWSTLGIFNSAHISVAGTNVIGNGNLRGAGIKITGSQFVTIRDNRLSGHLGSIAMSSTVDSLITRNVMTAASSDGIQVADSHRVIISSNKCSDFTPGLNAHPDCIQLWSVSTKPLQSNIFVINNSAIGNMQAYLSSDPKIGSGTDLTFAGNYAAVTFTHTVTCGNCINSTFFDNVLSNLPHAKYGPGSLKIGPSPTNVVGNNPLYDLRGRTDGWMPDPLWTSFVPNIAGQVGSRWDDRSFGFRTASASVSAVPEPAAWMMMGMGFALIGSTRRRGPRPVLA